MEVGLREQLEQIRGGGAGPGSHRDVTPPSVDRQTDRQTRLKTSTAGKLRAGDNYFAYLLIFQDR